MKIEITLQDRKDAEIVMQFFDIRKGLNDEDGITNAVLNDTGTITCDVDATDLTSAQPQIDTLYNSIGRKMVRSICKT